jgi:cellulose synthase/poly-beta-1,6-N-acetylglucosamine synthase-like glycosyltransferase
MIAPLLYLLLSLAYGLFILWIVRGLAKLRTPWPGEVERKVSVIIAARNEEQNIPYCLGTLLKQSYSRENLEILVVDDHSEDGTRATAERIAAKFPAVKVQSAPPRSGGMAPKKRALASGISATNGEIILTIDADCSAPARWVEKMSGLFAADVAAVSSWVLIPEEKSLPAQIEFLDTLALQLIGAAAIGWNKPFLANGANFGFRRKSYQEIGGYEGFAQMGSGDDDLFLQKIVTRDKGRILFNPDAEASVTTFPGRSWNAFFQQRIRWSSKAALYPVWIKLTEAGVFFYYLALLLGLPLALLASFSPWIPLLALLCKLTGDYILMRRGVRMVRRTWNWPGFILASLLHLAYIPVIGILGLFGRFEWKGRLYRYGRLIDAEVQHRR